MKAYFIKMFGYNRYTTEQILQAMETNGAPAVTLKLMTHLLAAELIWLERCTLVPPTLPSPWPQQFSLAQCKDLVASRYGAWIDFLNGLTDADFDKVILYKTFSGDTFKNELNEIITHVINHGTHTRAQIGQQLKFAGAETLPTTDYSYYLRLLNS
ncbi:DinB family protein [Mucilaginibacter sp. CAU 1740]|uniref:DinB family protein n=1 Tax=Mucilaginibacter sp. CAU 1740 TaxID=3140365 RepID=UPI00325AFB24